jgi:hypothetical protein
MNGAKVQKRKPGTTAGYSGTPLPRKLGIPEAGRAAIVDGPRGFLKLIGKWPAQLERCPKLTAPLDYIHLFASERGALEAQFPRARDALTKSGTIWVSWPKKASGKQTDLDEGVVREIGLANGLVDVKVCAVDETWSGLKFMYRLRDRGTE